MDPRILFDVSDEYLSISVVSDTIGPPKIGIHGHCARCQDAAAVNGFPK